MSYKYWINVLKIFIACFNFGNLLKISAYFLLPKCFLDVNSVYVKKHFTIVTDWYSTPTFLRIKGSMVLLDHMSITSFILRSYSSKENISALPLSFFVDLFASVCWLYSVRGSQHLGRRTTVCIPRKHNNGLMNQQFKISLADLMH